MHWGVGCCCCCLCWLLCLLALLVLLHLGDLLGQLRRRLDALEVRGDGATSDAAEEVDNVDINEYDRTIEKRRVGHDILEEEADCRGGSLGRPEQID